GERIADRLAAQGLAETNVREREGELLGHGHGESHPGLTQTALRCRARWRREGEQTEGLALGCQRHADERRRVRGTEMGACRTRADVVDSVDPPPAKGPAVVELKAIPPASERRAPLSDGPEPVAGRGRHEDLSCRMRKKSAARAAHSSVGVLWGGAGFDGRPTVRHKITP